MKNLQGLRDFIQGIASDKNKLSRYNLTHDNVWTLERVCNEIMTTGSGTFFGNAEAIKPVLEKFGLNVTKKINGYVCTHDIKEE